MLKEFKNPSNRYRPIPFWSWNDKLEINELEYQIEEMKKAGVGGYFMHARSGLKTEYLSDEWFDCIKAGIEKGKEVGLDAWAYDEEGWPSGFAGGIVPALSPDYHAKFMTMERHDNMEDIEKEAMIGIFLYEKEKNTFSKVDPSDHVICKDGEILLAIRRHTNKFYIDTMNKRAVEAFLQSTHEVYFEKFGEDFGTYMKGFFTDEPRLTCNNFGDLAWSDDLPEAFLQTYGYDIRDYIPALYLETNDFEKYRYDFWTMVSNMFVGNYMKTIYDWCEEHNCKVTGHIMMEESIFSQMTSTGGVMPFYEYFHIPGIDWLRRPISSPVIGKQVGSVACQLGKKQVLTESYALCGWDVSFEELKWIAEWQFVNGVNQICQHLQGYTIKGVRKRDYPPSLFTQQTWWDEYKKFNDYLGRLCVVLSEGNQSADVLLIHPMASGFVSYNGTRTEKIRILDDKFTETSSYLSGNHISYHFGDETIIKNHGSVKGTQFIVGEIAYKTVVLPHMYAIDKNTLKLLLEFIENGGVVLSTGEFPTFTNGENHKLELLKNAVIKLQVEEVRQYLKDINLVALSVHENEEEVRSISYQQRETKDGTFLFLVNHNQKETYETEVRFFGNKCKVTKFIADTGDLKRISCEVRDEDTIVPLTFLPMESHVLFLEKEEKETSYQEERLEETKISLTEEWNIESMELNSMTLEYCTYRIDDGEWQEAVPVIKLQNMLLDLQRPCNIELKFTFQVTMDLEESKEFYVVIEDASLYEIYVNGSRFSYKNIGYWKDKTFKKVNIKKAIVSGENEILLKTVFRQPEKVYQVLYGEKVYETEKNKITYDMEIENIYLLGDFGVVSESPYKKEIRKALITKGPFTIVDKPKTFSGNDFTKQGLTFFAGQIAISQQIDIRKIKNQRIILDLQKQNAPLIKVYVNDILVKDSLWAPYSVDITEAAVDGENKITLHMFASNRNLFGPHHHIDGECYNVGPDSFTGKWSWVERKSEADATEIFDREKNYWTDTYCFVAFGL